MNFRGKIILLCAVLAGPLFSFAAASFRLTALPEEQTAYVQTPFRIVVESDSKLDGDLQLPKLSNGTWVRNISSRGVRIVNGDTSYSCTLTLLPAREGTLEVGAITATSRGKIASTKPFSVKVLAKNAVRVSGETEEDYPLSKVIFGRITTPQKSYFCGEEIPLQLELFVLQQFAGRIRLSSYPDLAGLKEAVFVDRSAEHRDSRRANHRFAPPQESMRVEDGSTFAVVTFPCSFRVLKPGELKPEAQMQIGLAMPRRRGGSLFDDDFFDSFFSGGGLDPVQTIHVPFSFAGEIRVSPLPPPPPGTAATGLVGQWDFSARLSRPAAKVGEVVELLIEGKGNSSPDLAEPPRLEIPGFRIYPPETVRGKNKVEFKYALIPLAQGEKTFSFRLCWYDTTSKSYQEKAFSFTLPVARGENLPASSSALLRAPEQNTAAPEPESPAAPREEIFYQKAVLGTPVKVPLWRNAVPGIAVLLFLGVLAGGLCDWRDRRRENLALHPEQQRRRARRALLPQLQKDFRAAASPRDYLRSTLLPHLAEALGLPPGATPGEVGEKLTDPELKKLFAELETSGFVPGGADSAPVPPQMTVKLFKLLRRLSIFLCIFSLLLPLEAGSLNEEFDKGDFPGAVRHYTSLLHPGEISAALCYNLGGACCRMNDFPAARLWFTRARLLAPGDAEALENLNVVNRKLLQNEEGQADSPKAMLICLRDHLRPDQYLVFAAAMAAVLLILWGARRHCSFGWKAWVSAVAGLLLLLALAAAAFQASGPYSPRRAVVLGKSVALRSLPVSGAGRIEANLPGGSDAWIVEERGNFVRIQSNGQDGWTPAGSVEAVFPYGSW